MVAGKLQPGSQVNTTDLILPLVIQRQSSRFASNPTASAFVPYELRQLRADLYNLLKSELVGTSGFHWAPGSTNKGAVFIFVPALGRATHVGRIWFDEERAGAL
jgi:hypothetical protein